MDSWWDKLGATSKFRSNKFTRDIWKGIALPGLLYNFEVLNWIKEDMNRLEVQNRVGNFG